MASYHNDQEYQGFTNYPTWAVFNFAMNEEPTLDLIHEEAQHHIYTTLEKAQDTYLFADWLKEFFTEAYEAEKLVDTAETSTLWGCVLLWAQGQVDWSQLSHKFLDRSIELIRYAREHGTEA